MKITTKFKLRWDCFVGTKIIIKPVIRQIIDLIPPHLLARVTQQHNSDKGCHKYKTYDQFVANLFGQLSRCTALEDISVGIGVSKTFIQDLGLEQSPAKPTMSNGNKKRTYKVFESLYMNLLSYYCKSTFIEES